MGTCCFIVIIVFIISKLYYERVGLLVFIGIYRPLRMKSSVRFEIIHKLSRRSPSDSKFSKEKRERIWAGSAEVENPISNLNWSHWLSTRIPPFVFFQQHLWLQRSPTLNAIFSNGFSVLELLQLILTQNLKKTPRT